MPLFQTFLDVGLKVDRFKNFYQKIDGLDRTPRTDSDDTTEYKQKYLMVGQILMSVEQNLLIDLTRKPKANVYVIGSLETSEPILL